MKRSERSRREKAVLVSGHVSSLVFSKAITTLRQTPGKHLGIRTEIRNTVHTLAIGKWSRVRACSVEEWGRASIQIRCKCKGMKEKKKIMRINLFPWTALRLVSWNMSNNWQLKECYTVYTQKSMLANSRLMLIPRWIYIYTYGIWQMILSRSDSIKNIPMFVHVVYKA